MLTNNVRLEPSTRQAYFLNWQAAFKAGAKEVGGKAWNLGRLQHYGFNVPDGGVIGVALYQEFISANGLLPLIQSVSDTISLENIQSQAVKSQLDDIRAKICNGNIPSKFIEYIQLVLQEKQWLNSALAVRSSATFEDSATASFAGIHDSYLNILGLDNLLIAIKDCFASLWSQRAVAYRRKMEIADDNVQCAVIVMDLIEADAAGVAFSCDPSTGREDSCLINANFGLGESVVNGHVEPDTYILNRASFKTESVTIGAKQAITLLSAGGGTYEKQAANNRRLVLDPEQQHRLCLLINRIYVTLENFQQHVDIEWALKDNQFYLLQSRPVTVLPRYTVDGFKHQSDIWSNANFRDAVPMVISYLQRDSMMSSLNRIILAPFKDIGFSVKPGVAVAKYIRGRAYFNTGLYQWLTYDAIGYKPEDLNLFMGGHQPDIQLPQGSPYWCKQGFRRIKAILKNVRLVSRYQKQQKKIYHDIDRLVDEFKRTDLSVFSDIGLLQFAEQTENRFFDITDKYMTLSSAIGPYIIAINLLRSDFGDEAIAIVNALVSGRGNLPSAAQGYELMDLAVLARDDKEASAFLRQLDFNNLRQVREKAAQWELLPASSPFRKAFRSYMNKYGFRANYELDCSRPRWSEDPSYLLMNIAKSIDSADLSAQRRRQQTTYENALAKVKEKLSLIKRQWTLGLIEQATKGAQTRETAKAYVVKLVEISRLLSLEFGRRLKQKGLIDDIQDVFYCSLADVYAVLKDYWDGHHLAAIIEERKQMMAKLSLEQAPDVVIDGENVYAQAETSADGKHYHGVRLKPGDIMVAPSTDPSWTPLFINAGGIVLETGGYTSHGSIVAREYGIPAVVNLPGILSVIKNRQIVVVNADRGMVTLT